MRSACINILTSYAWVSTGYNLGVQVKYALVSSLAVAAALSASQAQAQETEALPEAVAEGERVAESYEISGGVDSGVSTISKGEIDARTPGSGDVNQLLKILPTVQFTRDEGLASDWDILDMRPANISISGGRIYENLITLGGVDVGSRLDVTNDNPYDGDEVAGNAAQNLWLDSDLVGEIMVLDSNISAEYGNFTGGVLRISIRDPKRYWAANGYVHHTSDAATEFNVSDATVEEFEEDGDELPDTPEYSKWRFGGTVDVPVSENVALLFGASRKVTHQTNYRHSNYGSGSYDQSSEYNSFLVKAVADLPDGMTLKATGTYDPYEVSQSRYNAYGLDILTKAGGYTGVLELSKAGAVSWEAKASYVHADTSRESSTPSYSVPDDVCGISSCSLGGNGDIDQTQDTLALSFKAETDVWTGTLRGGVQYVHVEANKTQPDEKYAFSRSISQGEISDEDGGEYNDGYGVTGSILCDVDDPLSCVDGEYATHQLYYYPSFSVDVALDTAAAWAEYDVTLGDFVARAGVRYDYDSFLGNHDVAPRLAAAWNLPVKGNWQLSAGANRYYGKSMLAYAIRQAQPNYYVNRRRGTVIGDDVLFTDDDWYTYREYIPATYAQADLKTPYDDELTAALAGDLFGGKVRLKGILRWTKDEFASSPRERVTGDTSVGSYTFNYYEITNDGSSTYKGLSLEWGRSLGRNHAIALSANYSETKTSNVDYFTVTDELDAEDELVIYKGNEILLAQVLEMNERLDYAAPFIFNATWTARWLKGNLRTNVNFRYRNGSTRIEDTGDNDEDTRYDIFDDVEIRDDFNLNLTAELDVARTKYGTLTLDLRGENIFNRVRSHDHVSTTNPWQFGRQFWIGAKYTF